MPTLDWIGKKAVVNHHREVPYRLIHCDKDKSHGDPDAGNLLVQGDNLEALLPYYAGKVKCIYIDPPYNTGNESWVYNDNVNSPEIRAWLGSVVGKEAEDLSRHDKWLCMMYPRLRLLKEFLSDDGSIWITADDIEIHYLKIVMDDIFGRKNFLANIIWQKKYSRQNDSTSFSTSHDHILVYAFDSLVWRPNHVERDETRLKGYSNPDGDQRGLWQSVVYTCSKSRKERPNLYYPVKHPRTGEDVYPSETRVWAYDPKTHERHVAEGLLWWGPDQSYEKPRLKSFLEKVGTGVVPDTIWLRSDVGDNQDAKREALAVVANNAFPTPKPERLLKRILEIATDKGDFVMDSFAGSGTTGAAAQKLGRRHLSVEMGSHATTHIVPRYKMIMDELGGGFRFCTLGEPLFDADGNVSPSVTFPDLAAHVFFCETGSPIPKRADRSSPLIGTFQNRAVYLLHSAEAVGLAREQAGNVLTGAILESLPLPSPDFSGARIVYAEGCTVPDDRLSALGVTFKQIPYQIEGI